MTPRTQQHRHTRTIVIDLFEGAEELDVVGPWEVLAYWTRTFPQDAWRIVTAAESLEPVTCAKGLVITPHTTWDATVQPDIVLEPGGAGSRTRLGHTRHLERLRAWADEGTLMTSVCTGALVLGAAGLLHERPAVTYHAAYDELEALDPTVVLDRHSRWVDDGAVVTAAGVSAGIDMALYLVGRLAGPTRAQEVQRGIEYAPRPPRWNV